MDIKNVLENQLEELQQVQKSISKNNSEYIENTCKIAETIIKLVAVVSTMN
jgi:hypothetical protein